MASEDSATSTEWSLEYRALDQSTEVEHLGGVPWFEAPIPRRWHRCRPQTRGWVEWFTAISRCPCGAISYGGGGWANRNSRTRLTGQS